MGLNIKISIFNNESNQELLNRDIVENREEFIERIEARRHKDLVNEALRARNFTPAETLAMGFDLIKFALKFSEAAGNA